MAAVGRLNFPKALREIRIHLCQTSKSSQGVRDFLEKYYVGLKKENPRFPFLVRECSGIQPNIYARYGFGNETSVSLVDKNCDEVFQEIDKLVKAQS
ncbi:NADH dehydrogenase [ubiquinone] 1 alpha subcomplex subunit 2-like [Paramuricea clavata]|nr:NADH dehydrogenase [ubiquinone] 1 alpha subcomplex subunit 2-like [Paramuricea clavata]CAB3987748.1 NADH dehydrogenase [ubiquinone] 1 alpha subcomplex subunit 2-like [Paramuricea clavata]